MNETESSDHDGQLSQVLQPHNRTDMFRIGWVITMTSLPVAGIGYRFFHQYQNAPVGSQNLAAAVMFEIMALILLSVGIGMLFSARRMPRNRN